jgi:hypothetical protein
MRGLPGRLAGFPQAAGRHTTNDSAVSRTSVLFQDAHYARHGFVEAVWARRTRMVVICCAQTSG